MYTCIHMYRMYVCVHVCMYVCMYGCMYVCMSVSMHLCTCNSWHLSVSAFKWIWDSLSDIKASRSMFSCGCLGRRRTVGLVCTVLSTGPRAVFGVGRLGAPLSISRLTNGVLPATRSSGQKIGRPARNGCNHITVIFTDNINLLFPPPPLLVFLCKWCN